MLLALCLLHAGLIALALVVPGTRWAPAAWALAGLWSGAGIVAAWRLEAAERQVLQQERLRAMAELAGGIAHDFSNALTPIVGFADLLVSHPELPRPTVQSYLQTINSAAQETAAVLHRLRGVYCEPPGVTELSPVDLGTCIVDVLVRTRPRWPTPAPGVDIRIVTDVAGLPVIRGEPEAIREMLGNLVVNAVEAMEGGGTLTVRARAEGDEACLEVSDTGIGMSSEVSRRCLEPFFSTKDRRGLGLSLVYGTIQRHGGSLQIQSEPGRGTTFLARLPLRRPA